MEFKLTRCLSIIALVLLIVELFFRMSFTYGDFMLTGTGAAIILLAIVSLLNNFKK